MLSTRVFAVSCSVLVALSSAPSALAARTATRKPVTRNQSTVEIVDVGALMKAQKIPASAGELTAVTANRRGDKIALLFVAQGQAGKTYSLYENGKAVITARPLAYGTLPAVFPPELRYTEDGYLVHSANPTELFAGSQLVSAPDNEFSFAIGSKSAPDDGEGTLYVPQTDSILAHYLPSGTSRTLYSHPGARVIYTQAQGTDIYYVLQESDGLHLYRNGYKLYTTAIANPANFLVTRKGEVFFFTEANGGYDLLRNNRSVFHSNGYSAFLFEGERGEVWHVGYEVAQSGGTQSFDASVYRGGRKVPVGRLSNMEGFIAFGSNGNYAFRGAPYGEPDAFRLYVNGKQTGPAFAFDNAKRDDHGIMFAGGKTYMRNVRNGRWALYEDGRPVRTDSLKDVWFIGGSAKQVTVYATVK